MSPLRAALVAAVAIAAALVGVAGAAAEKRPSRAECLKQLGGGAPARIKSGTTPASVLAPYAVLRRPQVPSDLPPASAQLSAALGGALATYDPALTRRLSQSSTGSVYVAVGVALPTRIALSTACLREGGIADLSALARVVQIGRVLDGTGPAYALVEIPAGPDALATPALVTSFSRARSGFEAGVSSWDLQADDLIDLVPDGVGAVRFSYTPPLGSFSLPAQNNLATGAGPAIKVASQPSRTTALIRRFVNERLPLTVTWLTAPGGSSVRTFRRPSGLLDEYVKGIQLNLALELGSGSETDRSSSNCRPAQRSGRPVQICKTTTRTCTQTTVKGHTKQHCTTTTKVTVSKSTGTTSAG